MKRTKTVVITGASSGIGMKLAELYARDGHRVAMLARRIDQLEKLADSFRAFNPNVLPIECDVTSTQSVTAAIAKCVSIWGKIDIAIANAGVSLVASKEFIYLDHIERTYQVNVFGAVRLFEAVIPVMRDHGSGQLVSIASLAGFRGAPKAGSYCSSKAALIALTESLRLDLKEHHIKVTIINPGFIVTPITDQNLFKMPFLLSLEDGGERIYQAIGRGLPVYSFPMPMAVLARIGMVLPVWLYDKIISLFKNDKQVTPH